MYEFLSNKIFWLAVLSWAIAQSIKIIVGIFKEKRFDFNWILQTGGMPSAHSASVSTLAFCIGKEFGFNSPYFAFACFFALVTMFDAQTWRRYIGVQAQILNRIVEDFQHRGKVEERKLRELVGHTPLEVFIGASIGILIAFLFY